MALNTHGEPTGMADATDATDTPVTPVSVATREEVDALKAAWLADGCWDLTINAQDPHFAPYAEELIAFQRETEARYERERLARMEALATMLGCPGNVALAAYVHGLEWRLDVLSARLDRIENAPIFPSNARW